MLFVRWKKVILKRKGVAKSAYATKIKKRREQKKKNLYAYAERVDGYDQKSTHAYKEGEFVKKL